MERYSRWRPHRMPGKSPPLRLSRRSGGFLMITETKTHRVDPDITVFAISGRLNLGNQLQTVEQSIRDLIAGGVRKLVIDLSELSSLDSSAIGMLVASGGR